VTRERWRDHPLRHLAPGAWSRHSQDGGDQSADEDDHRRELNAHDPHEVPVALVVQPLDTVLQTIDTPVDLVEPAVYATLQLLEVLVDQLEALVDLVEALVDLVEALLHLIEPLREALNPRAHLVAQFRSDACFQFCDSLFDRRHLTTLRAASWPDSTSSSEHEMCPPLFFGNHSNARRRYAGRATPRLFHFGDFCTERLEPIDEVAVAAFDGLERRDA